MRMTRSSPVASNFHVMCIFAADGIVKYMRKQVEPASLLLTGENYEKFLAREEPVVVGKLFVVQSTL